MDGWWADDLLAYQQVWSGAAVGVVRFERRDQVAFVTIDRPEALNALSAEVQVGLDDAWRTVEEDPGIRVAILTGTGRAFSAGADLKAMASRGPSGPRLPGPGSAPSVSRVTKPVIAAINGYCLAGAFELALACDLRIASDRAIFGSPDVKWNNLDAYGALRLPHAIPMAAAMDMLLTSDFIDASQALRVGLVSRVVPHDQLLTTCEALGRTIAANGPLAVQITKRLAYVALRMGLDQALEVSEALSQLNDRSPDTQEGPRAFAERRSPRYGAAGAALSPSDT